MSKNKAAILTVLGFGLVGLLFAACKTTPAAGSASGSMAETTQKTMIIAGYAFQLPSWWDSVQVEVPTTLSNEDDVRNYVGQQYGMDTGTKKTWKQALKTWAIASQRLNIFPVYLAHCYKTGEQFAEAAKIFTDLYALADTQGKNRDWYRVYLSYNAAEIYAQLGDNDKARDWFSRAAQYTGSRDSAISYYAGVAAKRLNSLEKNK
jgi:tetratricopeptide (TPR) repeat protein